MFQLEPLSGSGTGDQDSCRKTACSVRLNDICPNELKLNNQFGTIGCKSACTAFNTDQYCCRGLYGTPLTCRPSTWPVDYPSFFKRNCPDAYSYPYDDQQGTFTCRASTYIITFGI